VEASTAPVVKCSPLKSKALFPGFRIPKKTPSHDSRGGIPVNADCSGWGDDVGQCSPSFSCYPAAKMEESSSASQDVFSKTRIQKPSPNSYIKSFPVPGTQFGVSSSSSVTNCAPCSGTNANPASNTTDDLHRQQFTCITSTNNQSPPPSSSGGGDERRSRKQKSPRKGLDSRDVSTNL
jgi:hypothetical protein